MSTMTRMICLVSLLCAAHPAWAGGLTGGTSGTASTGGTTSGGTTTGATGTTGGTSGTNLDPTHPPGDPRVGPTGTTADPGETPIVWTQDAVAWAHAPLHHQFAHGALDWEDFTWDYAQDFLAPFDYDGDMVAINNWDHFPDHEDGLVGTVYYSVVETCTHWFVVYGMFHPRDWASSGPESEHENDMEGLVAAIRKDDAGGVLEAVITHAHWNFYSYVPPGSTWTAGAEDLDGELFMDVGRDGYERMVTYQEAEGHGVRGWTEGNELLTDPASYIAYAVAPTGSLPTGPGTSADYALVDLHDTLWPIELEAADQGYPSDHPVYHTFGNFEGNCTGGVGDGITIWCEEHSSRLPWLWDDIGDPYTDIWADAMPAGVMALDPAALFADYFANTGAFGLDYVDNRYIDDLEAAGWTNRHLPTGFPSGFDLDMLYGRRVASCP